MFFNSGEEIAISSYKKKYWNKVAAGELWLQFCLHCDRFIFYPREHCPHCYRADLEWKPTLGRGKLYSYTVVHVSALPDFKGEVPYIYALVELNEGVRIPTNIIDCPLDKIQVDMPVELAFIEREGRTLPVFKPI
mgnify:CR=1 FL=1